MSTNYRRWGKRALDLFAATIGLAIVWPVLIGVALAVWVRLGRPVFFRQLRPGRGGKPFTLVKFRTMSAARDAGGQLLPDAARTTAIGSLLRRTSLDELPELWNIVRGDMSLVGPRPLLMQYLSRYTTEQARRHEVRPGITGLSQVAGRNAISWEERLRLDVEYVERYGPGLDLEILCRTIGMVVSRKGISASGHATMPEFMGSVTGDRDANGPTAQDAQGSSR